MIASRVQINALDQCMYLLAMDTQTTSILHLHLFSCDNWVCMLPSSFSCEAREHTLRNVQRTQLTSVHAHVHTVGMVTWVLYSNMVQLVIARSSISLERTLFSKIHESHR